MKWVSIVMHPLLIATYSCIILFAVFPEIFSPIAMDAIPAFIGVVFITTFVIPLLSIVLLESTFKGFNDFFKSLDLAAREQRKLPFLSITAFYGLSTYIFMERLQISPLLAILMITVTALIGLLLIITFWYKISIHAAGAWGMAGIFAALAMKFPTAGEPYLSVVIVLIAGLTCAARLYLHKHTPLETWSGAVVGFLFCLSGVLLFS